MDSRRKLAAEFIKWRPGYYHPLAENSFLIDRGDGISDFLCVDADIRGIKTRAVSFIVLADSIMAAVCIMFPIGTEIAAAFFAMIALCTAALLAERSVSIDTKLGQVVYEYRLFRTRFPAVRRRIPPLARVMVSCARPVGSRGWYQLYIPGRILHIYLVFFDLDSDHGELLRIRREFERCLSKMTGCRAVSPDGKAPTFKKAIA